MTLSPLAGYIDGDVSYLLGLIIECCACGFAA